MYISIYFIYTINNINLIYIIFIYINIKDFSKERYNTHAKSYNSILYTKTNSATYIVSIFGTMCCL